MSGFHSGDPGFFHRIANGRDCGFRHFALALAVVLLLAPTASATDFVTKILVDDDTWAEITNTGTLNASNRLVESTQLSLQTKTLALGHVFDGAAAAGMLVPTTLVSGDRFFAKDAETGEVVVVEYSNSSFLLPAGTSAVIRWTLPGGWQ